jgi:hypothetical protein
MDCDDNIALKLRRNVTYLPQDVHVQNTSSEAASGIIPGSFPDVQDSHGESPFHPPIPAYSPNTLLSTPVKQRLSTSRVPDDNKRLLVKDLVPLLKRELEADTNISQSSTFINLLFPSSRLPFPIDDSTLEYLAENHIWNVEDARFSMQFQDYKEPSVADWLNVVGRLIGLQHGKKRIRIWHSGARNTAPAGLPHLRKPDLILLDRVDYANVPRNGIHWRMIRAFAETTSQTPLPKRIPETVNQKSYLIFLSQDNRRFIPVISFSGSGGFSLTVTDRQGQIHLAPLAIFAPGKDVALVLLKIIAFLMYGTPGDIGLDPSMVCDETGAVRSILVNNQTFTVVKRIYSLQALIGRGTKIWVVNREGGSKEDLYILKDSWVLAGRLESEIDFLDRFAGFPQLRGSVPALIVGEDIKINGVLDSTEQIRLNIGQINKHRVHRRHVTEPIGSSIVTFKSKFDFLSVIIDTVNSMSLFLYVHMKVDAGF